MSRLLTDVSDSESSPYSPKCWRASISSTSARITSAITAFRHAAIVSGVARARAGIRAFGSAGAARSAATLGAFDVFDVFDVFDASDAFDAFDAFAAFDAPASTPPADAPQPTASIASSERNA